MGVVARAPGKLVVLGEYAVLDGGPALALAVDRWCEATVADSQDDQCELATAYPRLTRRRFDTGAASGVPLVDLVISVFGAPSTCWRGTLDSTALYADDAKLGLGSSAAALCAFAAAWSAFTGGGRHRSAGALPDLAGLIDLHRGLQGGRGSGLDVAASYRGGLVEFRLAAGGVPEVGSVRPPNGVGFAGIFAGRSASTPEFITLFRAFQAARPEVAAAIIGRLTVTANAGCAAARGGNAGALVEAIAAYGRELEELGVVMGAEIVTAEHGELAALARRQGVAYKVSGAGGGDVGLAASADPEALARFSVAATARGFRVIDLQPADSGLFVMERP